MVFDRSKQAILIVIAALALAVAGIVQVQSDTPEVSFDGLHLQPSKDVAVLYIKPDADFSGYKRFVMLKAHVAFKKNWQRDVKVAGRRVSNKDMEKIKVDVAELFHETFKEQLEADDGYTMVAEGGDDVLILRPAIIDLYVNAPDVNVAGRNQSYVASAGQATLFLELYDSVSGEILARIIDRKNTRNYGYGRWTTSVSNRADAKALFKRWADMLREGLDEVHEEKYKKNLDADQ